MIYVIGLVAIGLAIWMWRRRQNAQSSVFETSELRPEAPDDRSRFDALLAQFAEAGFPLASGRSADELLNCYPVQDYVDTPSLILFMLGSEVEHEPWGRRFCLRAYSLDFECVDAEDIYETVFRDLATTAELSDQISAVDSHVDFDTETARLSYTIAGISRDMQVDLTNDWFNAEIYDAIMDDLEKAATDGKRFYNLDDGQGVTLAFTDAKGAELINGLLEEGNPLT